ncbi:hypothetical protein APHAL10511_008269 [Amanita phalloides]|nr:hypothetical protein APHAL10511_008269 [Amanita phalloides]
MNAWSAFCDVRFTLVDDPIGAEVRISFTGEVLGKPHPGYWSNVGTDILGIDNPRQPTMMLTGASLSKSDWFFTRVVRHETGHTLGFMHEHLRPELVDRIDPKKAIEYYGGPANYWSKERTTSNVLNPLPMDEYTATAEADIHSIMCYAISNKILKKGAGQITGGDDFSKYDREHAAKIYPMPKVDWTYVSIDTRTTAIAASGLSFYKILSDGQIQTYYEVEDKVPPGTTAKIGEFDEDEVTDVKIHASGDRLWQSYKEGRFVVIKEWQGGYGMDTEEWIEIEKNPAIGQIEYTGTPGKWKKLDKNEANQWIAATDTHLYKYTKNKNGGSNSNQIFRLDLKHGGPDDWKIIDDATDILQLVTTRRNVYQHHKNGRIYVYSGVDQHWNLVFQAPTGSKPSVIQARDDRLFRIVGGKDVWVNDNNHTSGWKRLKLDADWSSFVYTEGYFYQLTKEKGMTKRHTGFC